MESKATDEPVPREIDALLSDERLILREMQRAVTPFGGIAVFIFVSGQDRLRESDSAAHADRLAITESHRSKFHVHCIPGLGAVGSQTFRSRQSATG